MTVREWPPFRIIGDNARVYVVANVAAYGIFLIGFALGLAFPHLSDAQSVRLEDDGTADLVRSLFADPWLPFGGIALFAYWALTTGMTLVPQNEIGWVALIPHSLTLIVEFQAYLLLLLGVFLLGAYWVNPRAVGAVNRRQAYRRGLRDLGWLALPALVLFVTGAVYEAFSLRYFVHPLAELLL